LLVSSSATAAVARDEVAKRSGSNDVHLFLADISLLSSVTELARQINGNWPSLAGVIHHAAHHNLRKNEREVTADGFERFWAHNHLGPFLLSHLLKDALAKGHGRIVTVGSTRLRVYPRLSVDLADPNFERRSYSATRAFYQSKIAQIQFALSIARRWPDGGVVAKSACVPSVGSDSIRRGGLPWYRRIAHQTQGASGLTPKKIGELYAVLALSPRIAKMDDVYLDHNLQPAWAPRAVFDVKEQDAVWALSAKSVGL
jgi:NAD(P)-dependent dehydrogenase (short-subunit alcohol dehydrogenase family)